MAPNIIGLVGGTGFSGAPSRLAPAAGRMLWRAARRDAAGGWPAMMRSVLGADRPLALATYGLLAIEEGVMLALPALIGLRYRSR